MIEKAIMEYLLSIPTIASSLSNQIFYRMATTTAKFPYCIITNSGGMRSKLTQPDFYSMASDTLTIYIDDTNQFRSKDIANLIINALENYRGTMGTIQDTHFRCGTTRDLTGFQGSCRQLITVYVTYRIDVTNPN